MRLTVSAQRSRSNLNCLIFMEKREYISPEIEVIEVEIEKGFAASIDDWDQGVF